MIGNQISHYKIIEKLGEGGMGAVYKARDTRLLRQVAIKMLRPELMVDKNKRLHFIKEAQTASSLNHPNICTIYDINEANNQHFMVMELVEGKTLRDILEEKGIFSEKDLVAIAIKICEALLIVHKKGIAHRDIKPENIMITDEGRVKVMDFGLAKLATDYVESVLETSGSESWRDEYVDSVVVTNLSGFMGTVHYMSPEQAQGQTIDSRSDIFSLGIMLHELLTGQKPFNGDTNLDILTKIIREPFSLNIKYGKVSSGLQSLISKALEKQTEKRFQTIAELLTELNQLSSSYSSSSINTEATKVSSTSKKKSSLTIFLFVFLSFATGALILGFILSKRDSSANKPAIRTTRFTSYAGQENHPTFSPDGKYIAFSWNGGDQHTTDIYVKKTDGSDLVRLTHTPENDYKPVWSFDGNRIAFLRKTKNAPNNFLKIMVMSSNGGTEQEIIQVHPTDNGNPGFSWSTDNSSILYPVWITEDKGFSIKKINLETFQIERISFNPRDSWGDLDPLMLPDGKHLMFRRGQPGAFDLYTMHLEKKTVQKITDIDTYIYGFCWNSKNQSVLFSANLDGSIALWKTDLSGSKPEKVLDAITATNPHVSGTNNQLVYTHETWGFSIWKLSLKNPGKDEIFISSYFENLDPNISPDGTKVLFSSSRTGTHNIWIADKEGNNPTQLTYFKNRIWGGNAQWSPDGKKLLLNFQKLNYVMNTLESEPVQLDQMRQFPAWNTDGNAIYGQPHTSDTLYLFPLNGSSAEQITAGPGLAPKIYENYIYFIRGWEQREIWRIPVSGGAEEQVLTGIKNMYIRSWHVVKNGIYFFRVDDDVPELCFYDFRLKKIKSVKHIPEAARRNINISIDIDPQEEYLLYSRQDPVESDIILVDNFTY